MANERRRFRVAQQIRTNLASLLLHTADERFSMVTLISVSLSPDLKIAKVYWVVNGGPPRILSVTEAFEGARGFFRREMGKQLGLRHIPDLRFFYDETLDTVEEVDRLLDKAGISAPDKD
jgi:ribosome-binding factor A